MDLDLLNACCSIVERRNEPIAPRSYAKAVLELYLARVSTLTAGTCLTDEEKTARFERAKERGTEAVSHLQRQRVGPRGAWVDDDALPR